MAILDTFSVTSSMVQTLINPRFRPGGTHLTSRTALTVASTSGSTITFSGQTWEDKELAGLFVVGGSSGLIRRISSNTSTTLTLTLTGGETAADIADTGETATIRGNPLLWTSTEFDERLSKICSKIRSYLPEKYRQLLRRITGAIIVDRAESGQTTAALPWVPDSAADADLIIWKNPSPGNWEARSRSSSMVMGADGDYEVVLDETNPTKNITIHLGGSGGNGLSKDDRLVASFNHSFLSAPSTEDFPPVLTEIASKLLAYEAVSASVATSGSYDIPDTITAMKEEAEKYLTDLGTAVGPGIDAFDEIDLMVETRLEEGGGQYHSPIGYHG